MRAEELGYDIGYTWDHLFPPYGDRDGTHFECCSLLAAWAEATSRIELGPLVSCNSHRNPDLLADMARTVDHVSGGRVILGLGSGWQQRDYLGYGFEFGTAVERLVALEAALPRVARRLERLQPPPVRLMPLLIAGAGERRTIRLVAQHADAWHAGFPERPEELEPKVAALKHWCELAGRDPADIEWGLGVEPDDLDRFLRADAAVYLEMGSRQFTLVQLAGVDVDRGAAWLAWRDARNAERHAA